MVGSNLVDRGKSAYAELTTSPFGKFFTTNTNGIGLRAGHSSRSPGVTQALVLLLSNYSNARSCVTETHSRNGGSVGVSSTSISLRST